MIVLIASVWLLLFLVALGYWHGLTSGKYSNQEVREMRAFLGLLFSGLMYGTYTLLGATGVVFGLAGSVLHYIGIQALAGQFAFALDWLEMTLDGVVLFLVFYGASTIAWTTGYRIAVKPSLKEKTSKKMPSYWKLYLYGKLHDLALRFRMPKAAERVERHAYASIVQRLTLLEWGNQARQMEIMKLQKRIEELEQELKRREKEKEKPIAVAGESGDGKYRQWGFVIKEKVEESEEGSEENIDLG